MKATVIEILVSDHETFFKALLKSLEELDITGRIKTIQTTASLKSTKSWDLLFSNS